MPNRRQRGQGSTSLPCTRPSSPTFMSAIDDDQMMSEFHRPSLSTSVVDFALPTSASRSPSTLAPTNRLPKYLTHFGQEVLPYQGVHVRSPLTTAFPTARSNTSPRKRTVSYSNIETSQDYRDTSMSADSWPSSESELPTPPMFTQSPQESNNEPRSRRSTISGPASASDSALTLAARRPSYPVSLSLSYYLYTLNRLLVLPAETTTPIDNTR